MTDIKPAIKALIPKNRNIVKQAYSKLFPDAKKSRFRNILARDDCQFDAREIYELTKLFIVQDGKMVLNPSDDLFNLIGEPIEANV